MAQCTVRQIRAWRDGLAAAAEAAGSPMFMGRPEAWYEDLHWFCPNGHVSGMYLSGDAHDLCLACHEPVSMGPPMGEVEFAMCLKLIKEL